MNISLFAMEQPETDAEKDETEEAIKIASAHLDECKNYFIQQHQMNKIARNKNPHIKKLCDIVNQLASYHQILLNQVPGTDNQKDGVTCIREFYDKYFDELKKLVDFQKKAPNVDDIVTLDTTEDLIENYPVYQKEILKKCAQSVKEAQDNVAVMFGNLTLEEFSDTEDDHTLKRKKSH